RELGEVGAQWSRALDQAVAALERDRADRRRRAAAEIADLLIDVLSMHESAPAPEAVDQKRLTAELIAKLKARERRRVHSAVRLVEDVYGQRAVVASEEEVRVLAEDMFAKRSFLVFGLSARRRALTGAAAGAVTGGMIDRAVGGASLLLGAGIGAAIGGVGAVLGADRLARVQVLGTPLGGFRLTVGPITTPNAPWVILGRAVLHHRLVAERNHARRDALILDASAGAPLRDAVDPAVRKR